MSSTDLPTRGLRLAELLERPPDVLVVGGGITGSGVALDLALRGVRVGLVERGDWAGATSSASSRLVHGGLRYLEKLEIGLVRESCLERALLLRNAAGLVWPETFALPVHRGDRVGLPRMMAGLALYAALSLPRPLGLPGRLSRGDLERRIPGLNQEGLRGGGHYQDGATDDARLTLAVVLAALRAGALAVSRVEVTALEAGARGAQVELSDLMSGRTHSLAVRAAVLCGGPFTDELRARAGLSPGWVRPTRGSHVTVPRERLPTDGAVIFSSPVDRRVMFLIPQPRWTVIGTTDLDAEPTREPACTRAEVDYLLESANGLVPAAGLGPEDVVSTWAGLRPLLASEADPGARSREERIVREGALWTLAGGKLTGWRAMAEKLAGRLCGELGLGRSGRHSPTRTQRLPGALPHRVPRPLWSSRPDGRGIDLVACAHARRYGARAPAVAQACRETPGGLEPLDAETLLGEVGWAVREEDAQSLTDVFFRRTDLGHDPGAASAIPAVLETMSALLGWDAERAQAERAELLCELARRRRWRDGS